METELLQITPANIGQLSKVAEFAYDVNEAGERRDGIDETGSPSDSLALLYSPPWLDRRTIRNDGNTAMMIEIRLSHPYLIYVCDAATGRLLHSFEVKEFANSVLYSPDDTLFAINESGRVSFYDATNYAQIAVIDVHDGDSGPSTSDLAFHPTENLVVFAANDYPEDEYTVRVWDTLTYQQVRILLGHEDKIIGLAFSDDGTLLASSSEDGTVILWGIPVDDTEESNT